jgi:NAD(P)H-nitrite reductase large subunit
MKWYGVYRQKPKDTGFFMMRTKIPGGQINAVQARLLQSIADRYAHGFCDITTRQTIQYHWLRIEDIPAIFSELASVGWERAELRRYHAQSSAARWPDREEIRMGHRSSKSSGLSNTKNFELSAQIQNLREWLLHSLRAAGHQLRGCFGMRRGVGVGYGIKSVAD